MQTYQRCVCSGDYSFPWVVSLVNDDACKEFTHAQFLELKQEADSDKSVCEVFRGTSSRLWGRFDATDGSYVWSEITRDQALLYVSVVGSKRSLQRGDGSTPRSSMG
jgi:hypothetical protein